VAAGITKRAVTSSAPTADSAAVLARAIKPSRTISRGGDPAPMLRATSGSKPAASQRGPSSRVAARVAPAAIAARVTSRESIRRRLPNSRFSICEPERKTSLARSTPAARQPTRTRAVRLS
jgi:hypothetical protein